MKTFSIRYSFLLALILVLSSCQSEAQKTTPEKGSEAAQTEQVAPAAPRNIALAEFQEVMQQPEVQVLDVRTDEEVAGGVVEGAVHINVFDADFGDRAAKMLDKSKTVVVYCKSGGRSSRASGTLAELGFKDILNYTGGMSEWQSQGLPTVPLTQ